MSDDDAIDGGLKRCLGDREPGSSCEGSQSKSHEQWKSTARLLLDQLP